MQLGVSLPMLATPLAEHARLGRAAEEAGMDSVWDYELTRCPYMTLGTAAATTNHITLGTAIAVAFSRTPWLTANLAADVDELSGGRMILGLGVGTPEFLTTFHGLEFDSPAARMREYVQAVRASWKFLSDGESASYEGQFYRVNSLEFNPWEQRQLARPNIPLYVGAVRPRMLQVAGEVGDGLIGYLFTPEYISEVVLPNLLIGAERGNRSADGFPIVAETICSVHTDRDEAMRRARIHVGLYTAGSPVSDAMVRLHGLEKEQNAVREFLMTKGFDGVEDVVDDKLVRAFSISGTPEECAEQLNRYEGLLETMMFHTPYVPPITFEESIDSFHQILAAFGRN